MQIDVHDTYARTDQGELLHFDVLLPAGQIDLAERIARQWLNSIGLESQQISLERCRYCHSESANPEIQQEINQQGYAIIPMEGCPAVHNDYKESQT